VAACFRPRCNDVHFQFAICMGHVRQAAAGDAGNQSRGHPGHLFHPDRIADLVFAVAGLPDTEIRATAVDFRRRHIDRRKLGAGGLRPRPDRAIHFLRNHGRTRYRHYLCRHHRPDGAVVPRQARSGHRPGCSRLRLRCTHDDFSDRNDDQEFGLCRCTDRVRNHSRPGRTGRRPGFAPPPQSIQPAQNSNDFREAGCTRLFLARDAEDAGVLAVVRNDDDDVDRRPDGHFADGRFCEGFRGKRCLWQCRSTVSRTD
jgi:hypothetical protein